MTAVRIAGWWQEWPCGKPFSRFGDACPTFCRHNRFVAECPICSKGTVLDPNRRLTSGARRPAARARRRSAGRRGEPRRASRAAPFASAGPYEAPEIRLERVPGRPAAGGLARRPARERRAGAGAGGPPGAARRGGRPGRCSRDAPAPGRQRPAAPAAGALGASPGRTGELRDELRVERIDDERLRIARWIMRPNRGWELQEAPVMLPAERFPERRSAPRPSAGCLASGGPGE